MLLDRIVKETPDLTRFVFDFDAMGMLDPGETLTLMSASVALGSTGWSEVPFPAPGAPPPYDPTPLLLHTAVLDATKTKLVTFVEFGTAGNVYTCVYLVKGTSGRQLTCELGVQVTGDPPEQPLPVPPPSGSKPSLGLSIYGGTMQGPLYLFETPAYPTEAATKDYVDRAVGISGGPFLPLVGGTLSGDLLFTGAATIHHDAGLIVQSFGNFNAGTDDAATGGSAVAALYSGNGTGTANSGQVLIYSGDVASGTSGSVNISTGVTTDGVSGNVNITTGNANSSAFGGAGGIVLTAGNVVTGDGGGGAIALSCGNGADTGAGPGGGFIVYTGNGGGHTSNGGGFDVYLGNGGGWDGGYGNAGTFNINGASGNGSGAGSSFHATCGPGGDTGAGGDAGMSGGAGGFTSGPGGWVILVGGNATNGNAGTVQVQAGSTTTGNAGNFLLNTGDTGTGTAGYVSIRTGNASTAGNGGDLIIQLGSGAGAGHRNGLAIVSGLPSVDPHVVGALWMDTAAGRVLKVSNG